MIQYWMHQAGQPLRPAVEALLNGNTLSDDQLAAMRAHLKQWMKVMRAPAEFTARIDEIKITEDLRVWLNDALHDYGIDPL